jgi:hypothetical protein
MRWFLSAEVTNLDHRMMIMMMNANNADHSYPVGVGRSRVDRHMKRGSIVAFISYSLNVRRTHADFAQSRALLSDLS